MRYLALVSGLLGLALSSAWAQTTPLTWQELDALHGQNYSIASVEGLILRNVQQVESLNEEIIHDLGKTGVGAGVGKIIGHFFPPTEAPLWCHDAAEVAKIGQMQRDISTLADNVIKLEHVLFEKDPSPRHSAYWQFIHSEPMAKYHALKIAKPQKKACQAPTSPPVAQGPRPSPNDCMALLPTNGLSMFPPDYTTQQWQNQIIQQRTPAFQACMRRANGLPPINPSDGSPMGYALPRPLPPGNYGGCGVTVRC